MNKVVADPLAAAKNAARVARETLDRLQNQKAVAERHNADLATERQRISFRAHTDDKVARKRLSEIHREVAEHGSEMISLDAAIAEAQQRVTGAEADATHALEQQRAREALDLLEVLREHAAGCDSAVRSFLLSYDQLDRAAARLAGITNGPSRDQVRSWSKRALATALLGHRATFDFVDATPPSDRHSFAQGADAWALRIAGWAQQRLGSPPLVETEEEEAAA
jgi:uncharacterized membrane protein YkoI